MALTSCLLTSGIGLECRNSIGGIQTVYIGVYNGATTTYQLNAENQIILFTNAGSYITFNQPLETGEFVQNGEFSTENGTSFYVQNVTINIVKLTSTTAEIIKILGQGLWRILVLDQNGLYWWIGAQNGARVTVSTPGAGKMMGDLSGATITFEAKELVPAYNCTTAAVLPLIS